jgi:hypothetical protein
VLVVAGSCPAADELTPSEKILKDKSLKLDNKRYILDGEAAGGRPRGRSLRTHIAKELSDIIVIYRGIVHAFR